MVHVKYISAALGALACGVAMQVNAATDTFTTPGGSVLPSGSDKGLPVDASAVFITGSGTVSVTLNDLLADPTSVGQLISDLDFTLSNGATTGTLATSSGAEVTVGKGGTVTPGSTVSTGWKLNGSVMGGLQLDVLGAHPTTPSHLIIGPPATGGTYMSANGSIAGNKPHNPFLNQTATFMVDVAGVTPTTSITGAVFSFGTSAGINVPGTGTTPPSVPEPASLGLLAMGLAGLGLFRRRGRKAEV